jgi:hypothetical protein
MSVLRAWVIAVTSDRKCSIYASNIDDLRHFRLLNFRRTFAEGIYPVVGISSASSVR